MVIAFTRTAWALGRAANTRRVIHVPCVVCPRTINDTKPVSRVSTVYDESWSFEHSRGKDFKKEQRLNVVWDMNSACLLLTTPLRPSLHKKTVDSYHSPHKRFVYRTQITENDSQVTIKRILVWYDSAEKRYRKRIEFQTFDCATINECDLAFDEFVKTHL